MQQDRIDKAGVSLNDLPELAKKNPKYTNIYVGLYQIDNLVKTMVRDTVEAHAGNPSAYYIKTTLCDNCYLLEIYNSEAAYTIGTTWNMADFLEKCSDGRIELDVKTKTKRIIDGFSSNINHTKTIWI